MENSAFVVAECSPNVNSDGALINVLTATVGTPPRSFVKRCAQWEVKSAEAELIAERLRAVTGVTSTWIWWTHICACCKIEFTSKTKFFTSENFPHAQAVRCRECRALGPGGFPRWVI